MSSTIGERISRRRKARTWSIRYSADRAGLAHSTWSRIERGQLGADNRFTIAKIALALECSIAELTGQPMLAPDTATADAQAAVARIRHALVDTDLNDPATVDGYRPLGELRAEAELVQSLRQSCDYAGAGRYLPSLLREIHAATSGPERGEALRLLVLTTFAAGGCVRYVSSPSEYFLAAERCAAAARATEDPVLIGLGYYERAHAATMCGSYQRAYQLASAGADIVEQAPDSPGKPVMLGQLRLTAGFAATGVKRDAEGAALFEDATRLAEQTGDTETMRMSFGPTNVKFWQVSMHGDAGEPDLAARIARETNPDRIKSVSRKVAFYCDAARAFTRVKRDKEAIRYLLAAERLSPVRVHASPLTQETVRALLDRERRSAGGPELRGLCERLRVEL